MSERKPGKQKTPKTAKPAAKLAKVSSSPMDVGLLEQLVQLMSANDLNTVDLRDGDKRVVLKRGPELVQYSGAPMAMPSAPAAPAAQSAAPSAPTAPAANPDAGLVPVKSPMVGTFYLAPKQGEKAFVSVGSMVNEESDVCIIEAMKVFNVIKAETSGSIAKVLIQDGQPVEHGTVLFLVKPA